MFCLASPSFWCFQHSLTLKESIPRQVDKKSGVPKEERGVWGSQVGGNDKSLFSSLYSLVFNSVQISHSVLSDSVTPWTAASQASLSITNSQGFTQTHVHPVGDAIQLSHPLLFPSPPAFNLSQHQGLFK